LNVVEDVLNRASLRSLSPCDALSSGWLTVAQIPQSLNFCHAVLVGIVPALAEAVDEECECQNCFQFHIEAPTCRAQAIENDAKYPKTWRLMQA
jgi:hypothetical protein